MCSCDFSGCLRFSCEAPGPLMRTVVGCISGMLAVLLVTLVCRVLFDVALTALLVEISLPIIRFFIVRC
jgi:hypothetical protein